jgi:hypothetical protein
MLIGLHRDHLPDDVTSRTSSMVHNMHKHSNRPRKTETGSTIKIYLAHHSLISVGNQEEHQPNLTKQLILTESINLACLRCKLKLIRMLTRQNGKDSNDLIQNPSRTVPKQATSSNNQGQTFMKRVKDHQHCLVFVPDLPS